MFIKVAFLLGLAGLLEALRNRKIAYCGFWYPKKTILPAAVSAAAVASDPLVVVSGSCSSVFCLTWLLNYRFAWACRLAVVSAAAVASGPLVVVLAPVVRLFG